MGRMVRGGCQTCQHDMEIALRQRVAARNLHNEGVAQQDLHLCKDRVGERSDDLDARRSGNRHALLGVRHVLDDVALEALHVYPSVHVYTLPPPSPLLTYPLSSAIVPCFHQPLEVFK